MNFAQVFWKEKIDEYFAEVYKSRRESGNTEVTDVSPEYVEDYLYWELKQRYENATIHCESRWEILVPIQDELMIIITGYSRKYNLLDANLTFFMCEPEYVYAFYENIKDIKAIPHVCKMIKDNLITDMYIYTKKGVENQKRIRLHIMAKSLIEAYSEKLLGSSAYTFQLLDLKISFMLKIQKANGAKVELEIQDDNCLKTPELIKPAIENLEMIDKFLS